MGQEKSGLEYRSPIKEVAGELGSGLAGLYMEGVPTEPSFTASRNWQGLQSQQGPKMSKHHKIKDMVNTKSNKAASRRPHGSVDGAHMGSSTKALLPLPAEKYQRTSGGNQNPHLTLSTEGP